MNDPGQFFQRAIIIAQNDYLERLYNPVEKDLAREIDNDGLLRAAEMGLDYEGVWDETAVFIHKVFKTVEQRGLLAEWLFVLRQAVELTYKSPENLVNLKNKLGRIYYLNRNLDDALQQHEGALAIAISNSNQELIANTKRHLSHCCLAKQEKDLAEQYAKEALDFYLRHPSHNPYQKAIINNALGLVAIHKFDYKLAQDYFGEAIELWQESEDASQLARTYINMGVASYNLQDFDKALHFYRQATTKLDFAISHVDWLKTMNNISNIYYMKGEYARSEEILREAIARSRLSEGSIHLKGSLNHNMGNTLLARERYGEADYYLNEAIRFWEQVADFLEAGFTFGTLGELYLKRGSEQIAIEYYLKALNCLRQFPNDERAQKCIKEYEEILNQFKVTL